MSDTNTNSPIPDANLTPDHGTTYFLMIQQIYKRFLMRFSKRTQEPTNDLRADKIQANEISMERQRTAMESHYRMIEPQDNVVPQQIQVSNECQQRENIIQIGDSNPRTTTSSEQQLQLLCDLVLNQTQQISDFSKGLYTIQKKLEPLNELNGLKDEIVAQRQINQVYTQQQFQECNLENQKILQEHLSQFNNELKSIPQINQQIPGAQQLENKRDRPEINFVQEQPIQLSIDLIENLNKQQEPHLKNQHALQQQNLVNLEFIIENEAPPEIIHEEEEDIVDKEIEKEIKAETPGEKDLEEENHQLMHDDQDQEHQDPIRAEVEIQEENKGQDQNESVVNNQLYEEEKVEQVDNLNKISDINVAVKQIDILLQQQIDSAAAIKIQKKLHFDNGEMLVQNVNGKGIAYDYKGNREEMNKIQFNNEIVCARKDRNYIYAVSNGNYCQGNKRKSLQYSNQIYHEEAKDEQDESRKHKSEAQIFNNKEKLYSNDEDIKLQEQGRIDEDQHEEEEKEGERISDEQSDHSFGDNDISDSEDDYNDPYVITQYDRKTGQYKNDITIPGKIIGLRKFDKDHLIAIKCMGSFEIIQTEDMTSIFEHVISHGDIKDILRLNDEGDFILSFKLIVKQVRIQIRLEDNEKVVEVVGDDQYQDLMNYMKELWGDAKKMEVVQNSILLGMVGEKNMHFQVLEESTGMLRGPQDFPFESDKVTNFAKLKGYDDNGNPLVIIEQENSVGIFNVSTNEFKTLITKNEDNKSRLKYLGQCRIDDRIEILVQELQKIESQIEEQEQLA